MIYFDNAATSRPYKEVLDTYVSLCSEIIGNSSSANGLGTKALSYLEKARKQIKDTLGLTDQDELIFTSGATESNNEAIRGVAHRHIKEGRHLITSQGEHASVLSVFKELEQEGFEVTYLPLDSKGMVSPESLKKALRPDTTLVSLMYVNNEVGTIYPIEEYSQIIKAGSKAAFMSDLTQAIGKLKINFKCLDIWTMSGHKVGGLKSSGLLGVKKGILIDPLMYGGEQEDGMRSGTVNVPLACSLATALRIYISTMDERSRKADALRNYLISEFDKMPDEILLTSPREGAIPFVLNFALKHYKASVMVESLSAKDVYVSTRSACSSHSKSGSHVLYAMGYDDQVADNAIRLSFEGSESLEEGQEFISILKDEMKHLKRI
jgi:cysteine desulfurase